ncbi:hypothetical protein N7509_005656 [Penicillium cosmopolitanum]|uniref:Uncharacterized protein n=1 Tax=Penicillium cosmopolitanum TaxID=1131564 RepID=A0A9W9W2Z1_9EURO|nr:uncharacterized protein N7509_005656 [Penicillium cosmopolitanum]KAJ5397543.1 hypothetical protein N7509_005656 [Penicillium cosmopolitanum]
MSIDRDRRYLGPQTWIWLGICRIMSQVQEDNNSWMSQMTVNTGEVEDDELNPSNAVCNPSIKISTSI